MARDEDIFEITQHLKGIEEELRHAQARTTAPSPSRFVSVALRMSDWSHQERELIDADPALLRYEAQIRDAIDARADKTASNTLRIHKQNAAGAATEDLRAAAREQSAARGEVKRVTVEGAPIRIFAHTRDGLMTLHVLDQLPPKPIRVRVGERDLELIEPFDRFGRAVVRAADLDEVIAETARLSLTAASASK